MFFEKIFLFHVLKWKEKKKKEVGNRKWEELLNLRDYCID